MIDLLKSYIKEKDPEKISALVKEKPAILDASDENGSSGFMLIAYSEFYYLLEQLIEFKQSISFYEAIVLGKSNIVETYLESNPESPNEYSADGFTPLSLAAFFDQTEIAKLLIDNGADPNLSATNPSKVNALHSATAKENYELCKILIENGANVNATQMQNVTALHSAVHRGNMALTQLLVENGADSALKMDNGDSSVDIAEKEGHKNIRDYLLKK